MSVELPQGLPPDELLTAARGRPHRALLESAGERGRYSMLVVDPIETMVADADGAVVQSAHGGEAVFTEPFAGLEALCERWRMPERAEEVTRAGGIIGYLGYEVADSLERLPPPRSGGSRMPRAWFGVYDRAVVWDRRSGRCRGLASILPGRDAVETGRRLEELTDQWRSAIADRARNPSGASRDEPGLQVARNFATSLDREAFEAGVERIRAYIRRGDLFQANLTRMISVRTDRRGDDLYRSLVRASPAEFSAFLDTGRGEVASISPELFLSLRRESVRTRPIKGTAPRGSSPEVDRERRDRLEASEKDRAENVMIVDLLRNDLSRVCRPGSVEVPELARIESHPTVHHLVSTVTGRLDEDAGPVDLLRATFPCGSITGAPKIRAMEVLRELEPERRGIYTGSFGILGFDGGLELSVAIRTAVLEEGTVRYGTGGGITLASSARDEWNETEDKARALFTALGSEPPAVREPGRAPGVGR